MGIRAQHSLPSHRFFKEIDDRPKRPKFSLTRDTVIKMKISLISLTVICVLLCNVVEGKRKQPDYEWKRNFGGSQNVTEIAMVKDETDSTTGDIDTTIIVKTMVFGRRREKNSNVRGSYTQFFFPAKGAAKMVTSTFVADIAADPVYFNVTGMADVTDADLSARSSC